MERNDMGPRLSGWRPAASPYLWAIPAAIVLMAFALINTYAVFFIDSRIYVRSAAVAIDSVADSHLSDDWRSILNPRETQSGDTVTDQTLAVPREVNPEGRPPEVRSPSENGETIANNGITANRSIYYGALALLGYVTSNFWLLIFVQAYCVASCMALTTLRVVGLRPWVFLGLTAVLSIFTCVGPFVAYVMPDIFGGTIILGSITLLLGWDRLRLGDRIFLAGIIAFSALAHNSNVLLLASIFGAWLVWLAARRHLAGKWVRVATGALLLTVGPLGLAAFSYVVEKQSGEAPVVMPHLTAHLIDLGPGTAYTKEHCPNNEFAVCEFRDIFPISWTKFLGGASDKENGVFSVADLPTKRRLSEEQIPFALAVLKTYPLETSVGLLGDGLRQLTTLTMVDMKLDTTLAEYFEAHMPPRVWHDISGSTIARHPGLLDVMTILAYVSSLAGLITIAWFLYRTSRTGYRGSEFLVGWLALLLVAILANAAICGILASPMGRFSARAIWLLPFAAMLVTFAQVPRLLAKPEGDASPEPLA